MAQTIKFLRGGATTPYSNIDAAKAALNTLTHKIGQPVIAIYNKTVGGTTTKRALLAIGKGEGTGSSNYHLFAEDLSLTELKNQLDTHEGVMADSNNGTPISGHVVDGSVITYDDGEAAIVDHSIGLDKISTISEGLIGWIQPDGSSDVTGSATVYTAALIRSFLNVANGAEVNQNAFSNVLVKNKGSNAFLNMADAKTDTLTLNFQGGLIASNPSSVDDFIQVQVEDYGVALTKLAKLVHPVILGTKSGGGDSPVAIEALSPANVLSMLGIEGIFKTIKVGNTSIIADSMTDTFTMASGTNITLTPNANDDTVTIALSESPELKGTPILENSPASGDDSKKIATTEWVNDAISSGIATTDAMVYKGTIAGGNTGYGALTPAASKGWTYKVTTPGKIDGVKVEVGDMLICNTDNTAAATSSDYDTVKDKWDFIQTNIDGYVIGPNSATSGHLAAFSTATSLNDSNIAVADIVTTARKISAGGGLTGGGTLAADRTISHATANPTIGNKSIVTGVTADTYGHIATVTTDDLEIVINTTGLKEGYTILAGSASMGSNAAGIIGEYFDSGQSDNCTFGFINESGGSSSHATNLTGYTGIVVTFDSNPYASTPDINTKEKVIIHTAVNTSGTLSSRVHTVIEKSGTFIPLDPEKTYEAVISAKNGILSGSSSGSYNVKAYLTTGFVNDIKIDENDPLKVVVSYGSIPAESGKVRAASTGNLDYLQNKIANLTATTTVAASNSYNVQSAYNSSTDKVDLTCVIQIIDGGTFT